MGANAGKHKVMVVQNACLNLPIEHRFKQEYMVPVVCTLTATYKKHKMSRVLCGVDEHGVQHGEDCYASDMRNSHDGAWIELPNDVLLEGEDPSRARSATRWWKMKMYDIVLSADMLGKHACLPFSESPGAYHNCDKCLWSRISVDPPAHQPFSFLHGEPLFEPREWPSTKAKLDFLRTRATPKEIKDTCKEFGFNKFYFAYDPEYIPFVQPIKNPGEGLHLFPDGWLGIAGGLKYGVLFPMGLSRERVNQAFVESRHVFPPDMGQIFIHPKLEVLVAGRPKPTARLRMSGYQVSHYTLHSVEILEPLLTPEMLECQAWIHWKKVAELWTYLVQHEYVTPAGLEVPLPKKKQRQSPRKTAAAPSRPNPDAMPIPLKIIDGLIIEEATLFLTVPEYHGYCYRPKKHFLLHVAQDVWNFGPIGGIWCFGFEAFNKVIKRLANMSNFHRTAYAIMNGWSWAVAHEMAQK